MASYYGPSSAGQLEDWNGNVMAKFIFCFWGPQSPLFAALKAVVLSFPPKYGFLCSPSLWFANLPSPNWPSLSVSQERDSDWPKLSQCGPVSSGLEEGGRKRPETTPTPPCGAGSLRRGGGLGGSHWHCMNTAERGSGVRLRS